MGQTVEKFKIVSFHYSANAVLESRSDPPDFAVRVFQPDWFRLPSKVHPRSQKLWEDDSAVWGSDVDSDCVSIDIRNYLKVT